MTRLEYTAPTTIFGFPTLSVRFTELVGKTVLSVRKDGIGYTQIIIDTSLFPTAPTDKHVKFNPNIGTIKFPVFFEPGEKLTVLYQDIP